MPMETDHIKDLIFGYFSGESTPADQQVLSEWLKASADNRKMFAGYADWWAIAHVPHFEKKSVSDFEKLKAKMQTGRKQPSISRSLFSYWGRNIAVMLLILVVTGTVSYMAGYKKILRNEEIVTFETVVPLGSRSKVVLPDRSIVWVNAGSSLRYNEDFSENTREVYLKGEAYFEVMPDSTMPFIVKSGELDVKVLGTTFNVRAYGEDDNVDVVLLMGKVDVLLNDPVSAGQTYHLLPDEMLSYDKKTETLKKTNVNAADFCVWINGKLKFTKVPFARLAHELERRYNVRIHIASRSLRNELYSGSFTSEQTLDNILKEINIEGKYEWKQNGNVYAIYDK